MKGKGWIDMMVGCGLVVLALAVLASCENKSKRVEFSSPCSDVVDPWTPMAQEERIEACQALISSKGKELKELGFEPQGCRVTGAEVRECGIGTELACTYKCGGKR